MPKPQISFPKTFLWGASVSAHQVEGGTHNQWSVAELENAKTLATQASYQYGDLDNWSAIEKLARQPENYVSGRAVDHYNRYKEDFDLLRDLNMNTLRFSIEWSRIEPEEGQWNAEAIEYYRRYLYELKRRNITPVVTLFHFTLPVWFAERGGFERYSNVKYFLRFVEKVLDEYGPLLKWIITINEPTVYANQGYGDGSWPPYVQKPIRARRVLFTLINAHRRAAKLIHMRSRRYKVSMAYSVTHVYAGDDAWLSRLSARIFDYYANHFVLKRTYNSIDFIGLNYYHSDRVYGYRRHNPDERISDMGWDMHPADIEYVLEMLAERYKKPIMITENGLADADDDDRQWWLTQTIEAMHRARKEGVEVIGYLHWSLLDNFEWDKGRWARFGLYEVDYATMKRIPRASALDRKSVV